MFDRGADKRTSPRVEVQMSVDVKTTYVYTTAQVMNLSSGGLFIRTPHPLAIGSEFEIKLHFAKLDKPLVSKGVVRWVRESQVGSLPPGMGVELIGATAELRKAIEEQINLSPRNF